MVHEAGTMMQRFAALLTTVWRALAFALGGSFADIPRLGPRVRFPLESGHPGLSVHDPVSHCGQFAISVSILQHRTIEIVRCVKHGAAEKRSLDHVRSVAP